MNRKDYRHSSHKIALTVAVMIIFAAINAVSTIQAAPAPSYDSSPTAPADPTRAYAVCAVDMKKYADEELSKFREFIKQNFQNKSGTSSLLENSLTRYRELRTTLYNKYATYHPLEGASQLDEGISPGPCLQEVENVLDMAKAELRSRAVKTSTVKKASAIIGKYQQINSELRLLTQTYVSIKGYLDTFATKLPCYVKKSCNKG